MGKKEIRVGHLITPFGPGSLHTDTEGTPHIICGLDHWFKEENPDELIRCENRNEFIKFEARLSELLGVNQFFSPPDYRYVRQGSDPPPNARLKIPAHRFPRWYRHTKSGELRRFNLCTERIHRPEGGGRWQPVRFISVCNAGHVGDFPWKEWIGCLCGNEAKLKLTDRGGSELASISVKCDACRASKNLSQTTSIPGQNEQSAFDRQGIVCHGQRPWLGENTVQNCNESLVGALINQTNLYYARVMTAISLPDLETSDQDLIKLKNEIEEKAVAVIGTAKFLWKSEDTKNAASDLIVSTLSRLETDADPEKVREALGSIFDSNPLALPNSATEPDMPESRLLTFRRSEFNILRRQVDDPDNIPNLRVKEVTVPESLNRWFSKVNLVERLRETRVFCGFDRLANTADWMGQMPDIAINQLFKHPPNPAEKWLPAIEVFGEGIYLELNEDSLRSWQTDKTEWINRRLNDGFLTNLNLVEKTHPPLEGAVANKPWGSRYLLVHSLAHILINQFVFECGYSTASLKERLYISADSNAPMAGFMIYTAAGDSEGTLGGLVRLGRPERLEPVIMRALSRASWCSADPVCSENLGGQGARLANLAACHACTLLPETSCETINNGLDRAMVLGTPEHRESGFMSELVKATSWE